MNSDSICPQFLNNNSAFLVFSDEKEVHNTLENPKQLELIKEEGSLVSNSTTNSVMQNQSNATSSHSDDESCSSPTSEKKQTSIGDVQSNEIPSAWGKPLKKITTKPEESTRKNVNTNVSVVKVTKPGPPPKKNLRQAFYDAWRGADRALYHSSLTILPSKAATTSQKTDKEPLLTQTNVYKEALLQKEITEEQLEKQLEKELSRKLYCSVSGTSIFESSKLNLGYPVYFEKDIFMRFRPVPIMKLISYKAFFNSPVRADGDHWIPVYIDEAHFKRNYDDILDAIALIYQDIEEKDVPENFQPLMVLKVLPTLLVKTTIHFSKRNVTQSKKSIDTFCQLYRLFVKLVEQFPEIKEAIDKEIKSFCSSEANRHLRVQEDLGEFLIKMSVSSEGIYNSRVINFILQEHLARQASFSLKRERDLGKGEHECSKFLKTYLDTIRMSNEVLLSTVEMCHLFADKDVQKELETRCGVLNKPVRRVFLDRLSWIRRNVGYDWRVLIGMLQLESFVGNEQVMASYVVKSFETAKVNGYFD